MKLAICIPSTGEMPTQCAVDLATLVSNFYIDPIPGFVGYSIFHIASANLAQSRNDLVKDSMKNGCTHILWLDSDIGYPKDLVKRLAAHDQPIVGCNYFKRKFPLEPTALAIQDGELATLQFGEGLQEVGVLGMGATLVDLEVYKRIGSPYYWFAYHKETDRIIGEDAFFCMRCNQEGIPIYCDHETSYEILHYGTFPFGKMEDS
jgi:hypothetical protein